MRIFSVVLIVLGVLALVYGGFRYAYPDEIVDAGPVHVSITKHRTVLIPPLIGIVALVGGVGLLVAAGKRT